MSLNNNDEETNFDKPFDAYEGDEPYIFISYKHADKDIVFPVIKHFQDAGFNVWYDHGLKYGEDYDDTIDYKIDNSSLFVICITERVIQGAYNPNEYMKKELDVAIDTGTKIFPIYLDNVNLKGKYRMQLRGKHAIFRHECKNEESFIKQCLSAFINDFDFFNESQKQATIENKYNFQYLDTLIHNGQKEIKLEQDIKLDENEEKKYMKGIKIYENDILIDGNGFTIDAKGKTRIFQTTGQNITIKNITLKNGYSEDSGGAIGNVGSINIIDSVLIDNIAEIDGGALYNDIRGTIVISNTKIKDNTSNIDGGAIFNWGKLIIKHSKLEKNRSLQDAGAIHNGGLTHKTSISNHTSDEENIDLNNVKVTIEDTRIIRNNGSNSAGAILNWGVLDIKNSLLQENSTQNGGGAINNQKYGNISLQHTTLNNNSSYYGGAIYNYEGRIRINDTTIQNSISMNGGAIYNCKEINDSLSNQFDLITIQDSELQDNKAIKGGAIYTKNITMYNQDINKYEIIHSHNRTWVSLINSKLLHNEPDDTYIE